jgi:DNA-binding transcriptional regulator YiaG
VYISPLGSFQCKAAQLLLFANRRKPNSDIKTKSRSKIDKYVGSRIREGRISLNLSQEQLARVLGVSFQQIQSYEKGVNGVSAVRLTSAKS